MKIRYFSKNSERLWIVCWVWENGEKMRETRLVFLSPCLPCLCLFAFWNWDIFVHEYVLDHISALTISYQWFSGRNAACHAVVPGSIPGSYNYFCIFFSLPSWYCALWTRRRTFPYRLFRLSSVRIFEKKCATLLIKREFIQTQGSACFCSSTATWFAFCLFHLACACFACMLPRVLVEFSRLLRFQNSIGKG